MKVKSVLATHRLYLGGLTRNEFCTGGSVCSRTVDTPHRQSHKLCKESQRCGGYISQNQATFFFSQNCSDFGSSFVNSTKTCGKYIYIYCDNVLLNEADS